MKFLLLIFKNLRRNLLRTALTSAATMVLVFVVTLVWTVVCYLDDLTAEKSKDLKVIVTERWQVPSSMPMTYAHALSEGAATKPGDVRPKDSMTWQFYGGTLDPDKRTRENLVFLIALDPRKVAPMMANLEKFDQRLVDAMLQKKDGIVAGRKLLAAINKRVGERFKLSGITFKGIDLEFEIVGQLPDTIYNDTGIMNKDYLNAALESFKGAGAGTHEPNRKCLNLVWLKVTSQEEFGRLARQIESSSLFTDPAVKCETISSGIASTLNAYGSMFWFIKRILVPALLISMTMIIANAISITVRERRQEMAVLKVLGFRPRHLLSLVLGEALLLGAGSAIVAAGLTYSIGNFGFGGIRFPNSPPFPVPFSALGLAASMGAATALLGSVLPAWTARTVNVAEVFSKVT